jgi:hypothetical protein
VKMPSLCDPPSDDEEGEVRGILAEGNSPRSASYKTIQVSGTIMNATPCHDATLLGVDHFYSSPASIYKRELDLPHADDVMSLRTQASSGSSTPRAASPWGSVPRREEGEGVGRHLLRRGLTKVAENFGAVFRRGRGRREVS